MNKMVVKVVDLYFSCSALHCLHLLKTIIEGIRGKTVEV